jgi:secreted trypsin-like serine protease
VIQNGGKYTTVGIVSYGPADCGTVAGEYAVYTRVSGFITWINQQINSLTLPPQNAPNPTITIRGSGASSLSTASCLLLAIIIAVMF